MRHPATFISPGYGSFEYLRCGNPQCESNKAELTDTVPRYELQLATHFLIYRKQGGDRRGQFRFQCQVCSEITYEEDM